MRYWRSNKSLAPYLFILPYFFIFAIFWLGPTVFAFFLSLTNWFGIGDMQFVGLDNFKRLVSDESFGKAIQNTVWYATLSLLILVPLGLALALLLNNEKVVGRNLFRAVYFIPAVTSIVAMSVVFILLFDSTYGIINGGLVAVGLRPVTWLSSQATVKWAILVVVVWRSVGFVMVYFLTGLQATAPELYEAALVDGASIWQAFLRIRLPLLRPTILFVTVIVTINAFQIFEEPYILTRGGPADASLSIANLLFRTTFQFGELGYGAAIGVVIFLATFLFAAIEMKLLGAFEDYP